MLYTHTHTYVYIFVCVCVCVHHVYIYTHTYTYVYICIHTHTHTHIGRGVYHPRLHVGRRYYSVERAGQREAVPRATKIAGRLRRHCQGVWVCGCGWVGVCVCVCTKVDNCAVTVKVWVCVRMTLPS